MFSQSNPLSRRPRSFLLIANSRLPPRRVLIAAAAAASLIILGGIVVIIKNSEGQPVARVNLPEGRGATIKEDGKPVATIAGNGSKPDAEIDLAPGTTATFNIDNGEKPDEGQVAATGPALRPATPLEITPFHRIRVKLGRGSRFVAVDVSQNGRYFLASRLGADRTGVYETESGRLVREFDGFVGRFTPNGEQVITVRWAPGRPWPCSEFRVFEVTTGDVVRRFESAEQCWHFYLSKTGTRLFNFTPQGSQVWDWSTGMKLSSFPVKPQDCGILMPDGQHVLFQPGGKPRLQAYDAETGKPVEAFVQLQKLVPLGLVSSDGERVLCGNGRVSKVYDVSTGDEIGSIENGRVQMLSGDGSLLLALTSEREAWGVWHVESGRRVATLRFPEIADENFISSVTPDARYALITVKDSIYVFSLPDPLGGSNAKKVVSKPGNEAQDAKPAQDANAPPTAIAPFDAQQAKAHQEAWASHLGTNVEITNTIGMKLRLIPPGEFMMGSSREEIDALTAAVSPELRNVYGSECPQHSVRLTKGFHLGSHEVTQQEYQDVMGVNPSWYSLTGPGQDAVKNLDTGKHPVDSVSWFDAVDFCNKLSEKEGLSRYYDCRELIVTRLGGNGYHLPTEAEWEWACRAGTMTRWSFGDCETELTQYARIHPIAGGRTHPVGTLRANPFGLYDMHGNVWEWCWDSMVALAAGSYPARTVVNPTSPPTATAAVGHIFRGAAVNSDAFGCRSARRDAQWSWFCGNVMGFRVARSIGDCANAAVVESEPVNEDARWAEHMQHLPFVIGYEKGLAEAKAKNRPMMFFVTTTWCGWCTKHAQENFSDETVRSLLDKFVLVIVDGDTEPEALAALDAKRGFPHLIFQSSSGERLAEQVGYAPVDVFTKVVEDALAKVKSAVAPDELPVSPDGTDEKPE